MAEIGELYMKIAGRDAGKVCVVIDVLDERFVMIDGQTRRRKCNVFHLEPLQKTVKLSKNAPHEVVAKLFKEELTLELPEKRKTKKVPTTRPKKQKVVKNQAKTFKKDTSAKKTESKKDAKPVKAKASKEVEAAKEE